VNAVRVVVDNVVQNPTVAYTCSGTTLSFTSAPPTGTNNIYVVHLGPPAATVAPPTTINNATTFTGGISGDLAVDTNTLFVDSTNNHVGFGTATPQAPIDATLAAGGDWVARFQNTTSATPYGVQIYDAASAANGYPLLQVTNSAGSDTYFRVDSGTGITTKPTQPAFLAQPSSQQDNIAATGSNTTVALGTERFDIGSNFSANVFTAPVTGKYLLCANLYLVNIDSAQNYSQLTLNTSNRLYYFAFDTGSTDSDPNRMTFQVNVLADMDANDQSWLGILQSGGSAQMDIAIESYFSGALIC